jgi:DMSO/TMAO reductase YedYZ molybdopterin-dependent catalytic subunit
VGRFTVTGLMHLGLCMTWFVPWSITVLQWYGEPLDPVLDPADHRRRARPLSPAELVAWSRLVTELQASVVSDDDLRPE